MRHVCGCLETRLRPERLQTLIGVQKTIPEPMMLAALAPSCCFRVDGNACKLIAFGQQVEDAQIAADEHLNTIVHFHVHQMLRHRHWQELIAVRPRDHLLRQGIRIVLESVEQIVGGIQPC